MKGTEVAPGLGKGISGIRGFELENRVREGILDPWSPPPPGPDCLESLGLQEVTEPPLPLVGLGEGVADFQRLPPGIWTISLGNCTEKGSANRSPPQISWRLKEKRTLTSFEGRIEESAPPVPWPGGHKGPGECGCSPIPKLMPSASPQKTRALQRRPDCAARTQPAWTRAGLPR